MNKVVFVLVKGSEHRVTPPTYFQGVSTPTPMIYTAGGGGGSFCDSCISSSH